MVHARHGYIYITTSGLFFENFGDSHTFKADRPIVLLISAWIFRTSWPKIGVLWGKMGRGGAMLTPNKLVFTLGVLTYVLILVKIDQEMRP